MSVRFGVVRGFDATAWTVDVELAGQVATLIEDVPLAFHCRRDLVTDGTYCAVAFFDVLDGSVAVCFALFGGVPAADPAFDPVLGHKHRGLVGDGPVLD